MEDDVQKAGYCDGKECYYGQEKTGHCYPVYCRNGHNGKNCTLPPNHRGDHVNCNRNIHNRFTWENKNG